MIALVQVRYLVKTFGGDGAEIRVSRGRSMTLAAEDKAALLARSGSGKSTLLTILGTLMQPTSGQNDMLGRDLVAADDRALTDSRTRHSGFVVQFHSLLADFTVLDNVIFPAAVRAGRETAYARARGRELPVRMGQKAETDFRSAHLSGGQKQRVAVARALMNRPDPVLMDEPTGSPDSMSAGQVMDLIAQINRDEGTTFLISTRDEKIAARCRRRIVMGDGRVTG